MRVFLATVVAFTLLTSPAAAGLVVCNKSAHAANVALGHFNGTRWMSEGWWTLSSKQCESLIKGALDARYYYLFATDGASGTWEGGKNFCTAPIAKFAIAGRGNCAGHGFDRRGFFEIDTGQNPNWKQSLQ